MSTHRINIEYDNEDHTLGNLLQSYLMNNTNVSYVSYNVPNPSEKKCKFSLSVQSNANANKILKEEVDKLITDIHVIKNEFKNACDHDVAKDA